MYRRVRKKKKQTNKQTRLPTPEGNQKMKKFGLKVGLSGGVISNIAGM
jgi:hypothetical protein